MNKHYVYYYRTPVTVLLGVVTLLPGAVFYVGKGFGKRYSSHLNERKKLNAIKHSIIDRIRSLGAEPEVGFFITGVSDDESKEIEVSKISYYGRISNRTGTLANLTAGGDGSAEFVPSDKTRELWSPQRKGRPNPNKGIKRPGIGGRPKGIGWSEETRAKIMKARSQPGYYDYSKSPERAAKISSATKGRKGSATGKHWFNNGIRETYQETCPGPDFVPGRLARDMTAKIGMVWFNNGEVNRQFRAGEEDIGFKRGRISKK